MGQQVERHTGRTHRTREKESPEGIDSEPALRPERQGAGPGAGANQQVGNQEHRHQTEPDREQLQAQVEPNPPRCQAPVQYGGLVRQAPRCRSGCDQIDERIDTGLPERQGEDQGAAPQRAVAG